MSFISMRAIDSYKSEMLANVWKTFLGIFILTTISFYNKKLFFQIIMAQNIICLINLATLLLNLMPSEHLIS